jgi:lysophospholipase L1-like esterase
MGNRLYFIHIVLPLVIFSQLRADTLIFPTSEKINYYGRFDFTDPAKPRCNWSGAFIEASFPGPAIGMRMEHTNAFFDVEIDGKLDTVISSGSNKDFIFRNNLSQGLHTVRIRFRGEDHWGAGTFSGLYLADGKELSDPPAKPIRKIEFIGDSYTAGYGVESSSRTCSSDQLNKYTNANRTFARLVTDAFRAQSIILGWSGLGMVRNYGEAGKRSLKPFSAHYDQALCEVSDGKKWDYSTWKPELVVICLGTNDYSTTPNPDDSMYIGDYHKFIARVLDNYPDASILCVSTGKGTFENNVKKVVAEENSSLNHPKVFFAAYPEPMENTGCDWHPSVKDNVNVAAVIIDTVMKKLGWDTAATTSSMTQREMRPPSKLNITGRLVRGHLEIAVVSATVARKPLVLINLRGEVLESRTIGADGICRFRMQGYKTGIYLVGNNDLGWISVKKAI